MSKKTINMRALLRASIGILIFCALWEVFADSGLYSKALTPPLEQIFKTFWALVAQGDIFLDVAATLGRVFLGVGISFAIAVPIGTLMGRFWFCERLFAPLLSVIMPIPSLAWVPLFVLWFGIGDLATILIVIYAALCQLIYNIWTGVRALNPLWVKSARSMDASRTAMFCKIIWPGALPHILTGLRLAFGRAWIAVIGGELLASPSFGLGKVIFDAGEYLDAATILSSLIIIGLIGIFVDHVVLRKIEKMTIRRWGMVTDADH